MEKLTLGMLAQSAHPLLEEGEFSIFNDSRVRHSSDFDVSFDLDGFVCYSR